MPHRRVLPEEWLWHMPLEEWLLHMPLGRQGRLQLAEQDLQLGKQSEPSSQSAANKKKRFNKMVFNMSCLKDMHLN